MRKLLLGGLAAAAILSPPATAHAYPYVDCRTDYMSGSSYTYCGWIDDAGIGHRTVTTCLGGSNHCTTRDAG
jgi:hypothetical protein